MSEIHSAKWGIMGCARVARQRWLPALREAGAQIEAIASRSVEKAQAWAAEFCLPRSYGNYEALLADPAITTVLVVLPNSLHHAWVIRALEAGKHVLCDKPLGLTAKEARQMVLKAEEHNRLLWEGFVYQYHDQYRLVRQWLDEGIIGELRMIRVAFSFYFDRPGDFRYDAGLGGGALTDLGCYCINLLRMLAGREPRRTVGSMRFWPCGADVSTTAVLEFGEQLTAVFDCSLGYQGERFLHLAGTRGLISSDKPFTSWGEPAQLLLKVGDQTTGETVPTDNQYRRCLEEFSKCLASDAYKPSPARDSIANCAVMDAIRRSSSRKNASV